MAAIGTLSNTTGAYSGPSRVLASSDVRHVPEEAFANGEIPAIYAPYPTWSINGPVAQLVRAGRS
jgi:hypothetical protein